MKGCMTPFYIFAINHTWINHQKYIETISRKDFFKRERWLMLFSIGRWGFYIKIFWEE